MSLYLLTSGFRGLAPAGVPRGVAPWSAATFISILLASVVMIGCSAQPELPPFVDADIENCADFREVAAASGARGSTPPSVPLREKLGAQLLSLVQSYEDGGSKSVLAYARSKSLDLTEMRVPVRVLAASEQDVNCLERRITDAGGSIESNFENSIFAAMPVDALRAFAASEAVWRVDVQQRPFAPPRPPEPMAENPQDPKEDEE